MGGAGYHVPEVSPLELQIALKSFFVGPTFWLPSTLCFRLAICLLYLDLFKSNKIFRYCVYGLIVFLSLFFVGGWATVLRFCRPIEYNWDRTIAGECGDTFAEQVASAVINIVLDTLIVVAPIPIVWQLQMSAQKRLAIISLFALGLA